MQYRHRTCATSPGPGPIVRWPTSGAPLGLTRDRNNFSARAKGQQPVEASERRAVKEDELQCTRSSSSRVKGTGGARRRLSHLQQLADQRRAQLQQRVTDLVVHLAQRQLKNLH